MKRSRKLCIIIVIIILIFLLGFILLVVGLVMLSTVPKCEKLSEKGTYTRICNGVRRGERVLGIRKLQSAMLSSQRLLAGNSFIVRCHVTTNQPMRARALGGKFQLYNNHLCLDLKAYLRAFSRWRQNSARNCKLDCIRESFSAVTFVKD
jgi:hypothetical protein